MTVNTFIWLYLTTVVVVKPQWHRRGTCHVTKIADYIEGHRAVRVRVLLFFTLAGPPFYVGVTFRPNHCMERG
jgi:hypothetical protein